MNLVSGLIGMIYDAVPDASRWPVFLEAFVRATGGRRGSLMLHGVGADGYSSACWYGWTDDEIRLYGERYAAIDPWAGNACRLPEGEIATNLELCSEEELENSAAYREFYGPRDCRYGMEGNFLRARGGISTITMVRSRSDGPCGQSELAILRPLMPHLHSAVQLHAEWISARTQIATFSGHLDRYPHPFLLTDPECRVLYANAAARDITQSGGGLKLDGGRLTVLSASQNSAFAAMVRDLSGKRESNPVSVTAPKPSGATPYTLLLMPIADSGTLPLGLSQPAVAILIIDSESGAEPDTEMIRQIFSLTPAEARVTARLVVGRSVDEIAGEAGSSVETVRTHIRRVLSKTGASRQPELISLVLRSVPFRRPESKPV